MKLLSTEIELKRKLSRSYEYHQKLSLKPRIISEMSPKQPSPLKILNHTLFFKHCQIIRNLTK